MVAKKKPSKELANWDEQLAREAEAAAKLEANAGGGGQFFGLRSGVLTWQDAPMPNNEMAVIIVDYVLENVYYEGAYNPDVPQPPTCFAFGRDEKELEPHVIVRDAGQAQSNDGCRTCEHNEFGSAERGKGKACRNTRRLALLPAGSFDRQGRFEPISDVEHYETSQIGYMKLPVTSIKGFAGFVKQVSGSLLRPPHGIITKVRVVPDAKTQFKVLFEAIDKVPNALMGAVMKRREEIAQEIEFPYPLELDAPPPKQARGGKKSTRKY